MENIRKREAKCIHLNPITLECEKHPEFKQCPYRKNLEQCPDYYNLPGSPVVLGRPSIEEIEEEEYNPEIKPEEEGE